MTDDCNPPGLTHRPVVNSIVKTVYVIQYPYNYYSFLLISLSIVSFHYNYKSHTSITLKEDARLLSKDNGRSIIQNRR